MKVNKNLFRDCCLKCEFFIGHSNHSFGGECHKRPPSPDTVWSSGGFPRVTIEDWCGEFKKR